MNVDIEFIDYSDKSFVVRGEKTKEFLQRLKEEGGKYNNYLTDKISGKKFGGWIFKKSELERIKSIFESDNCLNLNSVQEEIKIIDEIYDEITEIKEQYLEFKIEKPVIGMKVVISYGKNIINGIVVNIKEKNNIVYQCLVKDVNGGMYINIGILGFEWKILDTLMDSKITFVL